MVDYDTYIGPNPAHLEFTRALINNKALFIMVQSNRDHLREWVSAHLEQKDSAGRQVVAFGIITEALSDRSGRLCHVLRHEAEFITANYEQLERQFYNRTYSDVQRALECFLVDLYSEIARADPRVLMSQKTITFEEAITGPDIVATLVAKQREQLSHSDRVAFCREFDGLGLPVLDPGAEKETRELQASEFPLLWEIRNVLEHRHGIVDQLFLRRLPSAPFKLGDSVEVTVARLGRGLKVAQVIAADLNMRAISRWPKLAQADAAGA